MEYKNLVQNGNSLEMRFQLQMCNKLYDSKLSDLFSLNDVAVFQARIVISRIYDPRDTYINHIFIRFFNQGPNEDDLTYTIKFSCPEFAIKDKIFTIDDGTWHLIQENRHLDSYCAFDVKVTIDVLKYVNSFALLHGDEEFTDFELRGEGGAVRIHRAVFVTASPVFRCMFGGSWKEISEGYMDVPDTSRATLVGLKDYVYQRTLPNSGLEQLLILATLYIMPELELKCVNRLVRGLTAKSICDLIEFAANNKITEIKPDGARRTELLKQTKEIQTPKQIQTPMASLMLAILKAIQQGQVRVTDIRKYIYNSS